MDKEGGRDRPSAISDGQRCLISMRDDVQGSGVVQRPCDSGVFRANSWFYLPLTDIHYSTNRQTSQQGAVCNAMHCNVFTLQHWNFLALAVHHRKCVSIYAQQRRQAHPAAAKAPFALSAAHVPARSNSNSQLASRALSRRNRKKKEEGETAVDFCACIDPYKFHAGISKEKEGRKDGCRSSEPVSICTHCTPEFRKRRKERLLSIFCAVSRICSS